MKPQTEAFLEKARDLLKNAATMLQVDLNEDAGRTAYLAGYHAAQALLFETTDKVFRTHRGVQGEFGRLVKDDPGVDLDLRAFLGRTYDLKTIADYESGPGAKVTHAQATEAIAAATRFVALLASRLTDAEVGAAEPVRVAMARCVSKPVPRW